MNMLQSVRAVLRKYADFTGTLTDPTRQPAAVSLQVVAPAPVTTAR